MTSLFLIAAEYRDAADKLADLDLPPEVVADTLEGLSGELEVKAQAVGHMVRRLRVDSAAMKEWAQAAIDRAKAADLRADSLLCYLSASLGACGIQRVEGPGIAISWRKSSAVVIDEPGLIPAQFMRQPDPPPPAPDKRAIGDAIKAGAEVPGAHIETRSNLQIK